jgi:hypothetical protein
MFGFALNPGRLSALSDQVETPDRKEFAPIQKLGKHVLVGKAAPLFRDMLWRAFRSGGNT